jgi:NNP family nitrate/nitrite transporter-like MFS transporter
VTCVLRNELINQIINLYISHHGVCLLQPTAVEEPKLTLRQKIAKWSSPPKTDPNDFDKATEWHVLNFSRPHMRGFHFAALGFFTAFFIWFAIAPLLPEIKKTLGLTKQQVWTTNIVSVAGTIAMRFIMGPLIDKYGPRIPCAALLILCAIPTACLGAVNSLVGLCILRFFIGLVGAMFVVCSSWTSAMFVPKIVGTANGFAAGWGNMGGGVTILVMGFVLFPLFKLGMSAEMAWRTVSIVPAVVSIIIGALTIKYSDDSPKGNFSDLKKAGELPKKKVGDSFAIAACNFNTWLMAFQYACTFGVELTVDNAVTLFFHEKFGLETEQAALYGSTFGLLNLFSRGCGGVFSDMLNTRFGMRGRLALQAFVLIGNGVFCIGFGRSSSLSLAVFILVVFSLFCQAGCGTSFGIAPYINPKATGSITGIIGAGGNIGAVCFGLVFKYLGDDYGFDIMGGITIFAALLTLFIRIPGESSLICGAIEAPTAVPDKLEQSAVTQQEVEEPSEHSGSEGA